MAFRSVF
ncbi:hypothetical protein VTL71DRAFT_14610 [Oculimacula yallundae]